MNSKRAKNPVRIGIDVGGTFTHAVAIDALSLKIIGRAKVPTTHRAAQGVALGIIDSLSQLLADAGIEPESVSFIAHSTTQATNALLEGDVAPVGILGLGTGPSSWLSRLSTTTKSIELSPGKHLRTFHRFIDTSNGISEAEIAALLKELQEEGARAIAISEAFSPDNPGNENLALKVASGLGLPATSGSQVSKLYGLKARTRTAVINAAMLPKMIETADLTESSVRAAGIKAPIMIMRSDGGVMDIAAMRSRPILTMLSGPAAGVAAAMMYLNISDGIFLEVGGTSTDISVIRNGKALVRGAEIGGHRVYLRTLDVKTLGVAGGSMFRTSHSGITDVGPRSAHIAGLRYASFTSPLKEPRFKNIAPTTSDPSDYLAIAEGEQAPVATLTPTCAANLLGLVPPEDCAYARIETVKPLFAALAAQMSTSAEALAQSALMHAFQRCLPVIRQFIADYKLDAHTLTLVGGGGGAAALVPFIARQMKAQHALAENADIISAIGVALALLRETVERNIVQPKQEDILAIRQEAFNAVARMGADPSSIEIHVEVDSRANVVRATACGATGLSSTERSGRIPSDSEKLAAAAASMSVPPPAVKLLASTEYFQVYGSETTDRKLFGLLQSKHLSLRTLDEKGIIRLKTRNGVSRLTTASEAARVIADLSEEYATFGDAGKVLPGIMLLTGAKIVDLSGLADTSSMVAIAQTELSQASNDLKVIVIAGIE